MEGAAGGNDGRWCERRRGKRDGRRGEWGGEDGVEMKRGGECRVCGGLMVRRHVESDLIEK